MDGICTLITVGGKVGAKVRTRAPDRLLRTYSGMDGYPKIMEASRRSSVFKAKKGGDIGLGSLAPEILQLILLVHFVCFQATKSICPVGP